MTEYYYDNPIDALFMMVNHGVKINSETEWELREYVGLDSSGGMYCIENPDILKPLLGDKYLDTEHDILFIMDEEFIENWENRPEGYIAFRNGIAFLPLER